MPTIIGPQYSLHAQISPAIMANVDRLVETMKGMTDVLTKHPESPPYVAARLRSGVVPQGFKP
eukprot:3454299-Alexandrium_andersonii.AAC.1